MPSNNNYQQRIFADRYARKDTNAEVQVGDDVIVSMMRRFEKDGETIESREMGLVVKKNSDESYPLFNVAIVDPALPQNEWEVVKGIERHRIEVLIEKTYEDICERIAAGVVENEPDNYAFQEQVCSAMVSREFIPAGRILAGLGCKDRTLTFFNCYVFPAPHDSREGIANHWRMLFDTFSLGGGIGWDNSTHRPRGSVVKKVNGRSSGAVSWMEQYSQITGAVEQGGSRRGAAMQALWIWHPDVVELISAKAQREEFKAGDQMVSRNKGLLENANVSILLTDTFMEAVQQDEQWNLIFPDTQHPAYDEKWTGDIDAWQEEGYPVNTHKTIKARELWDMIIKQAWASGEPGLLFMERMNKMSNSWYYAKLTCTNPCGEQALPPFAVCNLAHVNLSRFIRDGVDHLPKAEVSAAYVIDHMFDVKRFRDVVRMGVRFLDNVTDLNVYHDDRIEATQLGERRIGLGVLGYGELLVRLGLRYGSEEAVEFTDFLFHTLAEESYKASIELAQERGAFPQFQAERFLESGFMQTMADRSPEIVEGARAHGVRNVTINTVAPTGSVGTMLNTTTGIEPYFLPSWVARSRIGAAEEEASTLGELRAKYGTDLPSYFVTTQDITPEEHVRTQAAAQRWIDASISKTVNLPNHATKSDVAQAYELMYELGCKGGTVYRDGSRDKQVLYYKTDGEPAAPPRSNGSVPVEVVDEYKTMGHGDLRPKIDTGLSVTISKDTPVGRLHSTIRMHHKTGAPYDMFLTSGKGDVSADVQAMGRLISVILRWPDGETVAQETRLEIIRDQLHRIPGKGQVGYGPEKVMSLPDGIAQVLHAYLSGNFPMANVPFGEDQLPGFLEQVAGERTTPDMLSWIKNAVVEEGHECRDDCDCDKDELGTGLDMCPKCGTAAYVQIPGKCPYCTACGHTEC